MLFFDPAVQTAFMVCVGAAFFSVIGGLLVVGGKKSGDFPYLLSFGLAFAAGAMIYISMIEIFNKSYGSFAEVFDDKDAYALATITFFCGVAFLMLVEKFVPHNSDKSMTSEAIEKRHNVKRAGVLAAMAITIHNFPEGMATFFATLQDPSLGLPLASAIAVHNIPEGIAIAIPVYIATGKKSSAMIATLISAIAEPIGALLGFTILSQFLTPTTFGITFGMIAGAMVFLALDELLPTARRYAKGHETTYGMLIGMAIIAISLVLFK